MKIRLCFVSNSSSSSFICEVCGRTESGYDMCLDDTDMYMCVNDHLFCTDETVFPIETGISSYEVPEVHCPICTFRVYSSSILVEYCKNRYGDDSQEALLVMKSKGIYRTGLNNDEYLLYVADKYNLNIYKIFEEIRTKYGIYSELLKSYTRNDK